MTEQRLQRSWRCANTPARGLDQYRNIIYSEQSRRCASTHCQLQDEISDLQQLKHLSLELVLIVRVSPQLAER